MVRNVEFCVSAWFGTLRIAAALIRIPQSATLKNDWPATSRVCVAHEEWDLLIGGRGLPAVGACVRAWSVKTNCTVNTFHFRNEPRL